MSRVLVCGMTAQQSNPAAHKRVANFTGLLYDQLRHEGHDVWWQDPKVSDGERELARFDKVFVGLAPVTGLGSNRAYGALSTIDHMWGDRRLTLILDAPEPGKVTSSLHAVFRRPANLVKPFFSYRKDFEAGVRDQERLMTVVERLLVSRWPRTVYPGLPWQVGNARMVRHLPPHAGASLRAMSVDHTLLASLHPAPTAGRAPRWAIEPGSDARWLRQQSLRWPTEKVPSSSRREADPLALALLASSSGCLVQPDSDGLWWSTRFLQSLTQGCPVSTRWQEASAVGGGWDTLPGAVEDMTPACRDELAGAQLSSYVSAVNARMLREGDALHTIIKPDRRACA